MDLDAIVNRSDLHREIVAFFHENPASIDTARGISTWVRGEYESVAQALDELVAEGILVAHKASSTTGYSYTSNKRLITRIDKFLRG